MTVSIRKNDNIRLPEFLDKREKTKQIKKLKLWAKEKMLNSKHLENKQKEKIKDGQEICLLDKKCTIRIFYKDKNSSSVKIENNTIKITLSSSLNEEEKQKHISVLLNRCLSKVFHEKIERLVRELNEKYFGKQINNVNLKRLNSKWGSCSQNKNINLNSAFLFAPEEVIKYVCIHELAHLIEQNHSKNFWTLVKKAIPNYKEKIKWLKENKEYLLRFH
ncbi:MAG: M48 family metallopeptidase [Nanobdellota archaeon]